jgi:hypothetical protein
MTLAAVHHRRRQQSTPRGPPQTGETVIANAHHGQPRRHATILICVFN